MDNIHGSFWGDKMPLIMRKWACNVYVCSWGSQIKFDTRENIMESVFFFLQFPRKPEKWHNSSYHTTTGDYIVIICCLYPDGRRIFDRTAETTFVFVVLSLRLLGLVVSESRVPTYAYWKFFARGGGKPLAQKISQVTQIFTKESERKEGRITTT